MYVKRNTCTFTMVSFIFVCTKFSWSWFWYSLTSQFIVLMLANNVSCNIYVFSGALNFVVWWHNKNWYSTNKNEFPFFL